MNGWTNGLGLETTNCQVKNHTSASKISARSTSRPFFRKMGMLLAPTNYNFSALIIGGLAWLQLDLHCSLHLAAEDASHYCPGVESIQCKPFLESGSYTKQFIQTCQLANAQIQNCLRARGFIRIPPTYSGKRKEYFHWFESLGGLQSYRTSILK